MKKKIILSILFLVLLFSSCTKSISQEIENAGEDTITWWCQKRYSHVSNMTDSAVYKRLIEETDVSLTFIHPPKGEYRERFLVLLQEEIYPDIISHDFINDYPGGVEKALNDGVIIALNDIIENYCPNLQKYIIENPDIKQLISTQDGRIFCFPSIQKERDIRTYIGPYIRQDIFDTYKLDAPITVDQWYNALTILKEKTNNTPLSFYGGKILETNFLVGAYGISWGFYIDEGVVKYGVLQNEFEIFINELKKWYDEGLISPGVFTDSMDVYIAKAKRGNTAIYIDYVSSIETYRKVIQNKQEQVTFTPINYPVLTNGNIAFSGHISPILLSFASAYISKDNKDIEKTAKLLDYAYSYEGGLLFNFGIEGESYNLVNNIPIYTKDMYEHREGLSVAIKEYLTSGPYIRDPQQFYQMLQTDTQKMASEVWCETEAELHLLPTLILSEDEAELCALYTKGLNDIILNWLKDYMLDSTGDIKVLQLQNTLKEMGIEETIKIYQKAIDNR